MPAPTSIADFLRHQIAAAPTNVLQLARTLGLNQPSLWRFINEGVDPKLATAEQLLCYFGYVVVREVDAKAQGLAYIRPAADPPTKRKAQRERNAAARAKAMKGTKGAHAVRANRPTPKRSAVNRRAAKRSVQRTRQV